MRCRVSEEWGGLFIGRRYCSTHEVKWDDGGPCPKEEPEPPRAPDADVRRLLGISPWGWATLVVWSAIVMLMTAAVLGA